MTVTRIQSVSKNRYRIYIDDRSFCILYRNELTAYDIAEGKIITEEVCEQIKTEVLIRRARLRAMNLLMKHSFTEYKLREKLTEGGYPNDIVDDAIQYVVGYGYVDDRAYARDYIVSHSQDKSIRRLISDLRSKGVSGDIIDEVLNEVDGTIDSVDEESQIRRLLNKRRFDITQADPATISKTCAYLAGRGYSMELIRRVLKDIPDDTI
ncbi:MAG: regulatory protein RecX [Lachnospiraceae bacterium]|nr:regulatory protein RecX [Lachnospiraceae bacterium]